MNVILILGTILLALASSTSALPPCSCGRFLKPVCGSDDETYVNECRLQCAQQTDPQLTLKHEGPCSGGPNFQSCICPLNYLPVCGTDGNNYPNLCALECEKKKNNLLGLRHKGNCESRDNKVKRQAFSACTCTRKLEPVCGTDGVTYNNLCLLECAAVSRPDLRISHPGPCDNSVKVVEQPEPELKPECICKRNMKPVCGSDGNTYNNECLLRCAGPSLRVEYNGACVDKIKVVTPELNCNCNRDLKPVCGSDGMTYNNDCILRCSGNPVSVVREGPC